MCPLCAQAVQGLWEQGSSFQTVTGLCGERAQEEQGESWRPWSPSAPLSLQPPPHQLLPCSKVASPTNRGAKRRPQRRPERSLGEEHPKMERSPDEVQWLSAEEAAGLPGLVLRLCGPRWSATSLSLACERRL